MFIATTTCTAIAMFGYRLGVHDIKDDAAVTRRHFDGKFAELGEKVAKVEERVAKVKEKVAKVKEANMQTQRIVWTCAAATWKGFKGDTTAIENFVQSVDTFDKIIDCVKKGEC